MPGPMPHILEQPNIPRPLHGLNPRALMGKTKWDVMRRQVYRKHGYTCAACGVRAGEAKIRTGMEAHEHFRIDYGARRMTLIDMQPLCHACHSFVHSGLLEVRLAARKVSGETVATILGHGVGVLELSGGKVPVPADYLCRKLGLAHGLPLAKQPRTIRWGGWTMVWEGEVYRSRFPTEEHWRREMRRQPL